MYISFSKGGLKWHNLLNSQKEFEGGGITVTIIVYKIYNLIRIRKFNYNRNDYNLNNNN